METTLLTISKIFTERLFRIPDYQRGYAWGEKQLKDFWTDLEQLDRGKNHYVGVLTLESVDKTSFGNWTDDIWIIESKKYEPYYIVDGQQRLTTAIILIECIIEHLNDSQMLNFTSKAEIKKKFIFESKDGGISRSYVFGYEKDNPSYEFLKSRIFNEVSEENYLSQETIYTSNLEYAKSYFKDKLKDLELNEIEIIYEKITQNFLFNIYSISDDIDVFVTFETMNNRGKPLSLLELLKNRLIYLTTRFNEDEYEKSRLRKKINECWKTIYHNLGKNKDNPLDDDVFLYNHIMIYFGNEFISYDEKRNERYMVRKFRSMHWGFSDYLLDSKFSIKRTHKNANSNSNDQNQITIREINEYVDSLQYYVELWYKINNPQKGYFSEDETNWLRKIGKLGYNEFAPLLMIYFKKITDTNNRIRLLKSIEKFKFIFTLVSRYDIMYPIDMCFICAVDLYKNVTTHDAIIDKIDSQINIASELILKDGYMRKKYGKQGFYNWDGIRYFMYEYEESLRVKNKSNQIKLNWIDFTTEMYDFATIEHIFPQNSRKEDWSDFHENYSIAERKILRNSLGNLLPLSKGKNSSLQNKPFNKKLGSDVDNIGYKYGCYSENEVACYNDWTSYTILERGIKLLTFMEKRWSIKLGSEQEKIQILGLDFITKRDDSIKLKFD